MYSLSALRSESLVRRLWKQEREIQPSLFVSWISPSSVYIGLNGDLLKS